MARGDFVSKPLVHFLNAVVPGGRATVCGLQSYKKRYDGNFPTTTANPEWVTCWSCQRTKAWKASKGA